MSLAASERTEYESNEMASDGADHDRFSHYVESIDLMDAMVHGVSVTALCGKRWVPSRNGDAFPLCSVCEQVYHRLPEGGSA